MKQTINVLWLGALVAALGSFLPNLIAWLTRSLDASRRIEDYTAEILASAKGIAVNTGATPALKQTIAVAPTLLETADSIQHHAAAIEQGLAAGGEGGAGGRTAGEGAP